MRKFKMYQNELYKAGVPNWNGEQFALYYQNLATSYVTCTMTARQMAYAAIKMAEQKEYGFNECMKEFDLNNSNN